MSRYREQLAAAVAAVTVVAPTRYTWLGRRSRRLPASLVDDMDRSEQRRYLVACLREELYSSFYCHGGPVAARWGEPEPVSGDPSLVEAMSQANAGRGSWEWGWTVESVTDGQAIVTGPRLRVRIPVADCDGDVRPGAAVAVRVPSERPSLSPGFWTVVGDTRLDDTAGDVRVYWNVRRSGAPVLIRSVTSGLNDAAVPFRLKVADHPFRLDRCDAAVLYLGADDFRACRDGLAELANALAPHLRPAIPAFTLELAPGVGLAEDPQGDSFGGSRCAMLAEGIVRAHEQGLSGIYERVQAVADRFAEQGVAIDAPYLEPSLAGHHVL